ncbi:hypothetical protein PF008_g16559 [Phytophthora fragariae]|uniref:Secreted protein n=1 Tax=Phytophthora fragariae TaxID=53985 RepID=A0A6G0RBZ5_9STRA|nr:hypothetical protein PF008_g16559 [Phytophthora fragariae]
MFVFAYLIIDLSCGFGWCGSPAFYAFAGTTINDIYDISQPGSKGCDDEGHFYGNVWCDDHTCFEVRSEHRNAVSRRQHCCSFRHSADDAPFVFGSRSQPWASIRCSWLRGDRA